MLFRSDSKVPLLGDIPVLGAAFRRQVKDDEKTELLIFMTPHVVAAPEDLSKIASKEKEQMEMAPKAFDEKELKRYITKP